MIIYKATNLINGKIYVGQTTLQLEKRAMNHYVCAKYECKSDSNRVPTYFHKALMKYGFSNFKFEVLEEVSSLQELNEKEAYWIEELDTTNRVIGYNLMTGGKSGLKPNSTRKKISDKKKTDWEKPELRNRMRMGLEMATQAWKEKCANSLVEFICPVCKKSYSLRKYEAKNRRYCSRRCASKNCTKVGLEAASKENSKEIAQTRHNISESIKKWCLENVSIVKSCPKNKVSTHLLSLYERMLEKYGVKDWRTLSQAFCGSNSKKEFLSALKKYCENICRAGLN